GKLSGKYFFVPLQTHNDFQILEHSGYRSVEKFIIEVLESFAKNCSQDWIVFKHHPVDRGRKNYKEFILDQATLLGIEKRVLVLYDTYLPDCLKNAKGTITINSTVGLSSITHGTPTITLGNAIYDIKGLTSKGVKLDDFWHKQKKPDKKLLEKYRSFIIKNTQLNGSFYGKLYLEIDTTPQ
ncbi:MAG: capsular biosynthesis protein, partial [Campylobacterota bacterium]|nr:capsular biosynthesis protein [Campylobacterota bacterium]